MPAGSISMRKIKEVLRLRYDQHLSIQQIASSLRLSKSTVSNYIKLTQEASLSWPLAEEMDEADLAQALLGCRVQPQSTQYAKPDFGFVHNELKRKGVTLQLLWEEYASRQAGRVYSYTRFTELYAQWRGKLKISLRQTHRAGEKMFVDYAGQTVALIDPNSGELGQAQIFVAVLGASNYSYAEATYTQSLPDWISSHLRAFAYFGGVAEIIVPDNLRAGVSKACRYEPDLNPTYAEMAAHYQTAVIPARPYKPKDKAKVEVAVQLVERWILARLRNRTFFSLAELNSAIRELMKDFNSRPFKKLEGSRLSQFEELEKAMLKPLPASPYQYAEWKKVRAGFDYHVEIDGHYYSVPYSLSRKQMDARITVAVVEILYRGKRVASHVRSYKRGAKTTLLEHMPKAHLNYMEWTPERLLEWAASIGPFTQKVVLDLFETKPHPEQGSRSSRGLVSLAKHYGPERLEQACKRAVVISSLTYQSVANILKTGLDKFELALEQETAPLDHENVRGAAYYADLDNEFLN